MSLGNRSGVHCTRAKLSPNGESYCFSQRGFPQAGRSSKRIWPRASKQTNTNSTTFSFPNNVALSLEPQVIYCLLMFTDRIDRGFSFFITRHILLNLFFYLPIMDLGSKSRLDLFIFRDVQELSSLKQAAYMPIWLGLSDYSLLTLVHRMPDLPMQSLALKVRNSYVNWVRLQPVPNTILIESSSLVVAALPFEL